MTLYRLLIKLLFKMVSILCLASYLLMIIQKEKRKNRKFQCLQKHLITSTTCSEKMRLITSMALRDEEMKLRDYQTLPQVVTARVQFCW